MEMVVRPFRSTVALAAATAALVALVLALHSAVASAAISGRPDGATSAQTATIKRVETWKQNRFVVDTGRVQVCPQDHDGPCVVKVYLQGKGDNLGRTVRRAPGGTQLRLLVAIKARDKEWLRDEGTIRGRIVISYRLETGSGGEPNPDSEQVVFPVTLKAPRT